MLIRLGYINQHYDSDGNPIDTTIPTLSLDITAVNDIMEDTTIPTLSPDITAVNDIMEDTAVPAITLTMELIDA